MPKPPEVPVHRIRDGVDPVPELCRMAARTPLVRDDGPGANDWVVSGREEARAVLGDAQRFTTRPPAETAEASRRLVEPGNLLQYDPPEHTRLRQMLTPEFTVRRMRRMEPLIERIVEDRLDVLERAGKPADLMRHFARPVPGLVGCALVGVPRDDQAELARTLDIRSSGRGKKNIQAMKAFNAYMVRMVAQRRRAPGDDLLSMLILGHGEDLDDRELGGVCASLVAGGFENAAEMLALGTLVLLEHPDQLQLLRKQPELTDGAVEELLRHVSVVSTASPRTALADVPMGDQVIKAGDLVDVSLFAANRIQPPGAPPDRFDITREQTNHLAFGHGIHFCVGAALARMELRIAYAALLRRFPDLRLAVPPGELRFRPLAPQYGLEVLPVTW
ncbi:cytochrome P450 [Streptomyces sp. HUAS TT20]|uniref:cytochrome P450 n=1 Tax=Streptomyces sp. HUAS TT20 TaxID=3447509 RepID=UPI0021D98E82|nr:cytochrome P450 [Streptomyces sp. HUAS 15-9]UXY31774.1 cytochrome P450 [Streptomyces sp. HUAS 15-9]